MNHWIRITTLAVALSAAAALSGCIVTSNGAGAEGTSYVLGHLDGSLHGSPQSVVKAAKSVLEEDDMHIVTSDATGLDGKVVAKTALDTTIDISVTRQDEASSKISIRVGTFGDHKVSVDLFEKIKAKLP